MELTGPVGLSVEEQQAIFSVLDAAVYSAGRTSVMMALRGSKAEKIRRLGLMDLPGHGFYAGWSEADVLAKIDTCFHRGWLRFERTREGLPLIGYTDEGLEKAKGFAADLWLKEVCGQAGAVAGGAALQLSFLMSVKPERNLDTVLILVERVAALADASWLPLLRAWREAETNRIRGYLGAVIERLEGGVC